MALSAAVSSSLPTTGSYYYQQGNIAIPVVINVYNDSATAVQLKQLYLTQASASLGTGASLGLGEPVFRYIASTPNTTNNIIPAYGTGSYDALYAPQVNALSTFPTDVYDFSLSAVVQQFGYAESVRATPALFKIFPSKERAFSIQLTANRWAWNGSGRPPQYNGFDILATLQETLQSGEIVQVPIADVVWRTDNNDIISVYYTSPTLNADANGFIDISGGSITIGGDFPEDRTTGVANVKAFMRNPTTGFFDVLVATAYIYVTTSPLVAFKITPETTTRYINAGSTTTERTILLTGTEYFADGSTNTTFGPPFVPVYTSNNPFVAVPFPAGGRQIRAVYSSLLNPYTPIQVQITANYLGFTATAQIFVQER
jgi:hypothetical protein